ncbi:hypothetical protein IV01_25850 [Pseudomonas syringae]|uniref:Uncharacterized protein n=2 Tax=Pseudomonas syringae TaxID=317 RepID=A0A085V3U6_PSESX|nr:hypothetical protein IV01_25850 [Pseudomonas syringae]
MSMDPAVAFIEMEVAKIARSSSPAPDMSFVMGMIEIAQFVHLLDKPEADRYRDRVERTCADRVEQLRGMDS